jgi:uncharacterized protein
VKGEPSAFELTAEERGLLLRTARQAIEAHLRGERLRLPEATGGLRERCGAFVTLCRRRDGELRGCVGLLQSEQPLLSTVARMAVAAATEDSRFDPVTVADLPGLEIDISALSPLRKVRPEEVEVGVHGLVVSHRGRRGVLLPQVAVENHWDRETFLAHTCWKAGLPLDTWREPGVEILGFTAKVFGEDDTER